MNLEIETIHTAKMENSITDQRNAGVKTKTEQDSSDELRKRKSRKNGDAVKEELQKCGSQERNHQNVYVSLKELPAYSDLNSQVQEVVKQSTWWEIRGVDWAILLGALAITFMCFFLLRINNWLALLIGGVLSGLAHSSLSVKGGHLATHGVLSTSRFWNKLWSRFFVEFLGSYTGDIATEYHVKFHHPHTNIIGLGDSSSWKIPGLSRLAYMFVAPLILPLITPFVATFQLWGRWKALFCYICVMLSGYLFNIWLLIHISQFTVTGSIAFIFLNRAVMSIPYIHVNIFQHIGLSMYSKEDRPTRLYQMATGVLNLDRNPFLDWCFGLGISNCHVEHHLFPQLSDYMCLKVKPVVSAFFKQHNLPYQEKNYSERLHLFLEKYEELMVNAPTIIHFVGIQ